MASYREFVNAFRELGLNPSQPVIVHASLKTVGDIRGGPETVLGALSTLSKGILAPTFTYKTLIIPPSGPANNAIAYGTGQDANRMAEFFMPDMPADPIMGILPETLRRSPQARRSIHPILSFAGINVDAAIDAQTIEDPLAPIGVLEAENGIVLLIGVDHTVNTSIHYVEQLVGRKRFTRWALTPQGVKECPNAFSCSQGFGAAEPYLRPFTRQTSLGGATLSAVPLRPMIETLAGVLRASPHALLCEREGCEQCETVRRCTPAA